MNTRKRAWTTTEGPADFAHELKACLHVEVKAPLLRLVNDERVVREKVAGLYLYCSPDAAVRTHQLASRRARDGAGQAAPEGDTVLTDDVKAAIILFFSVLDEQQRRLFAGLEALQFNARDRWIAELLGVHVQTVAKGRRALLARDILLDRSRRPGGGRTRAEKKRPRSSRTSKP